MTAWRAPREALHTAVEEAPALAFQRIAFAPGLAVCRVNGRPAAAMDLHAPPEDGPRLHLQFVRRGRCRLVNDIRDTPMNTPGAWLHLTPAGEVAWRTRDDTPLDVLSIDLALDSLARELGTALGDLTGRIAALDPSSPALAPDLRRLAVLLVAADSPAAAARMRLHASTLSAVSRWLEIAGLDRPLAGPPETLAAFARRRLGDPSPPRSLALLAEEAGVSQRRLADAYRARYDASLFQDLLEARLRFAATLLAHGGLPVKQVAWQAGYTRPAAFSHAFRRRFGVAPQQLRGGQGGSIL